MHIDIEDGQHVRPLPFVQYDPWLASHLHIIEFSPITAQMQPQGRSVTTPPAAAFPLLQLCQHDFNPLSCSDRRGAEGEYATLGR